jgi:hypothetical protein
MIGARDKEEEGGGERKGNAMICVFPGKISNVIFFL